MAIAGATNGGAGASAGTGGTAGTHRNIAEQRLGRLRAEFDYMTLDDVVARGLHEFIDSLQTKVNDVGNAIFETFFASQPLPSR